MEEKKKFPLNINFSLLLFSSHNNGYLKKWVLIRDEDPVGSVDFRPAGSVDFWLAGSRSYL